MKESQALIPAAETALATTSEPSIGQMLNSFLQRPDALANVEVAERMFALYERQETRNAEKDFNQAFVALQADLPAIVASTPIPNRGKYERYEDLATVVNPLLQKHGFSVSFTMETADGRITETCHLRHVAGHSTKNSFTVRAGGKADSDTQADCKAATTAKRYAFQNALNLVIRQDALNEEQDDANLMGTPISFEQAETLRELVKETATDTKRFLAYAQAESFDLIMSSRYEELFRFLQKKALK